MAKEFPSIDPKLSDWIELQKLFFVSTAPLAGDGLINCSPKGMDSFRILGPTTVGYLDLTGSGAETIANLKENGRIVFMFTAFEGAPRIVRFHGTGTAHLRGSPAYDALISRFSDHLGSRSIIVAELSRISDSCGYSVPLYDYKGERDVLTQWCDRKGSEGLEAYRQENNRSSLNQLPAWE